MTKRQDFNHKCKSGRHFNVEAEIFYPMVGREYVTILCADDVDAEAIEDLNPELTADEREELETQALIRQCEDDLA